jgi:hypothetical protein
MTLMLQLLLLVLHFAYLLLAAIIPFPMPIQTMELGYPHQELQFLVLMV